MEDSMKEEEKPKEEPENKFNAFQGKGISLSENTSD